MKALNTQRFQLTIDGFNALAMCQILVVRPCIGWHIRPLSGELCGAGREAVHFDDGFWQCGG